MTRHFTQEQLDSETLNYLKAVVAADGKRMPGIYNATSNYWPVGGLIIGLSLLVATILLTFPPTEEPAKEACLQTAGFLLGGWMVTAAFRVWIGSASGKRLGNFVYADSLNLYEVAGSSITVTDLSDIQEAKVTQNFNEGKYQNSSVVMKLTSGKKNFTMYSESAGKRMAVYLNSLAYMRAGGEDGTDEQLKELSPIEMASVARHIASTGQFPRNLAEVDEVDVNDVPAPRTGGSGFGGGFVWYLLILGAGTGLFFGFLAFNKVFREDTIYGRIMELPAKDQPPALRLYLSRPDFTKHRAEAEEKLEKAYLQASTEWIKGKNPEFQEGLRILVMALAKKPQPVISLVVEEGQAQAGDPQAKTRAESAAKELADLWSSTIGDELVIFAQPGDPAVKGMVHISYQVEPNGWRYTVAFRKGPDEEPFKSVTGIYIPNRLPQTSDARAFADHLVGESCGLTRMRPQIPLDQDF